MTGSALGLIITAVVVLIVLAAWIVLVFYADAHPEWERQASRVQDSRDCASREMDASSTAGRDQGTPGERAAGIVPGRSRAA